MKTPKSISAESRIYRIKALCELLGVTRITLWRWVRSGQFPRPVQLGPNTKGVPKGRLRRLDGRPPRSGQAPQVKGVAHVHRSHQPVLRRERSRP